MHDEILLEDEPTQESKMPDVTQELVRFVAIRTAKLAFKEWSELPIEKRKELMGQARSALRAERLFFKRAVK